jgi:ketosteroid isomerase-like protein
MKISYQLLIACIGLSLISFGCSQATTETGSAPVNDASLSKSDKAKIKAEIQAIETEFAAADNARNVNAILAFYSDDAVTMGNGVPMSSGKAAIKRYIEEGFSENEPGSTVTYEVLEVFGNENLVTETGKSTRRDATGKVISNGKYMAIWEKHDGKYLCIRDIGNSDTRDK